MAITGLNDRSIEYLFPFVIEDEKQIIRLVGSTAEALTCDADARELAAEVGASEKRHLHMLQDALARSYLTAIDTSIPTRPSASVSPTSSERLHVGRPPVVVR